MRFITFNLFFLQLASFASQTEMTSPTKVKIAFVEALAPKDTTSSERFQKEYETAVALGKAQVEEELARCGYELSTKMVFYDASLFCRGWLKEKKISHTLSTPQNEI
jgi:hypothetical protein